MQGSLQRDRLREGKDLVAAADTLRNSGSEEAGRIQKSELRLLCQPLFCSHRLASQNSVPTEQGPQ